MKPFEPRNRYAAVNTTEMNVNERINLFRGKAVNIEKLEQSNVIRIFISSTFSDMAIERNLLLEKAYPNLRTFCQQIGLELQAFIGNRYGYRPIPSSLSSECYNSFSKIIEEYKYTNSDLISEWYKRDDNAVPPCYILQPITAKYPSFDDADPANADKRMADRKSWEQISSRLSEVLRQCAKKAMEEEYFEKEKGMLFFKSVTEMEIEEGLLSKSPKKSIFMYRREITDIADHVEEPAALRYVDLKGRGTVDEEAQTLLEKLKSEIAQVMEDSDRIKIYPIQWLSDEGINPKSKIHMNYLEKFCNDFVTDMKTSISLSINSPDQNDNSNDNPTWTSDWMFEEVAHHTSFAQKKCELFCGRTQLIETIYNHLFDKDRTCPVTAFGESGKGKTALMGMLTQYCRQRSENDVVIYRFLGTSPNSSHIHNVLQTLILQITEAFQLPVPAFHMLQNFNSVVQRFSKCLNDVSQVLQKDTGQGGNLIIILDSLDQLSPLNGAYRLNWLSKKLPRNVKILLSTLPDMKLGVLTNLRYSFPGKAFIEVPDLDEQTGKEILDAWLAKEKRSLTDEQHQLVMDAFSSCPTPLFLKLAFDEAKHWHSYTDVSSLNMAKTAREAISLFFDRLELVHGHMFVSRALGYLVAAKSGISEGELEDLLSLDNDVLDGSYTHWSPPSKNIVRIPSLLWTRLRFDLGGDIVERQTVGHTVLALYHRQFVEVARERYLSEDARLLIHEGIAEYFLGTWSDGKKKPLRLKVWKNKVVHTNRQVASQPFKFSDRVFNFRKLDELPYQLLKAGMWKSLCEIVLCNATWLEFKIKAFAIKDVLDDFMMVLEEKPDPGITLIHDAIKLAKPTLEFPERVASGSGDIRGPGISKEGDTKAFITSDNRRAFVYRGIHNHLCSELYGRLAYFKSDFPETVGRLVRESSQILRESSDPNFIPLDGSFQPPGGPLRTTLTGFSQPITSMKATPNKSILVAGSREGLLIAWQVGTDEIMYSIKGHTDEVTCLAISETRLVSGSPDNTLHVINVDSGSSVAIIKENHSGYKDHGSVELSKDSSTLVSACGTKINVWDISGLQCRCSFNHSYPLSCAFLLVEDAYIIAGYRNGKAICWSMTKGEKAYEISNASNGVESPSQDCDDDSRNEVTAHSVKGNMYLTWWKNGSMTFTDPKNGSLVSSFRLDVNGVVTLAPEGDVFAISDKNTVQVWTISNDQIKHLGDLRHHHSDVTVMEFSASGKTLVVGSKDEQITAWSVQTESFEKDKYPLEVIQGMGADVDHLVLLENVIASASSKVFYIKLWNLERKKIVKYPTSYLFEVDNNQISPCGRFLAIFDNFSKEITIYDLYHKDSLKSSLTLLSMSKSFSTKSLKMENCLFTSICFPSTSDYLLCGTNIGCVFKIDNSLAETKRSTEISTQSVDLSHNNQAASIIVVTSGSNCQSCLAVTRNQVDSSETLLLFDAVTMTVSHTVSTKDLNIFGNITAACLGNTECTKSYIFVGTSDCLIHVIVLEKQNLNGSAVTFNSYLETTLSDHESSITVLSMSPDQSFVFSGSLGKTRRLWHFVDEEWKVHQELFFESLLETGATHAAFTKNGKYVVSGSQERSLKLWDVSSGQLVTAQYVYATVTGITTTDDNRVVATTKMGYVIANEFHPGKSREEKRKRSISPQRTSQPKTREQKGKKSSFKTSRGSSACRIV